MEAQPVTDREDPVSSMSHDAEERKASPESFDVSSSIPYDSENNEQSALQVTPSTSMHEQQLMHSVSGSSRDVDTHDVDSIAPCASASGRTSEQLGEQLPCTATETTRSVSFSTNSVLTINPSVGYDIEAGHIVRV